jgi:integrase
MRLVLSDNSFRINGIPYEGFPIILDDDQKIVEDAHWFLIDHCIKRGRVNSKGSWHRYGKDLYDFFGFVITNKFNWKAERRVGVPSVIESYRDWSLNECGLKSSTINQRLRTIILFYRWALKIGIIQSVPFESETVFVRKQNHFFQHIGSSANRSESADILLTEKREPIQFLTRDQVKICLNAIENPTHRLLLRLPLQTGLRSEEFRTFPLSYVVSPTSNADGQLKNHNVVLCRPEDMRLKGSKPRKIHVPRLLMGDLWEYSVFDREKRIKRSKPSPETLFLTRDGNAYSASAIERVYNSVSDKVGFRVTPHMARHTYATYTLHGLRERGYKGDALMYLRDRLGHSSVTTTQRYLHLVEEIDADLMIAFEEELNALFMEVEV